MIEYKKALNEVYSQGIAKSDRTGTGTISKFNVAMSFDLKEGFPLVTSKKMFSRGVIQELLWFISGSVNVQDLRDRGVNFWNEWELEDGTIGPGYGKQFRDLDGRDPLGELIKELMHNPDGRRHVLSLWNFADIPQMALPCCHGTVIQFYVSKDHRLSCSMYQRSGDMFLGVPVNIASYALLTHMIARVCGYDVDYLHITIGDAHIYENHLTQVEEQLSLPVFPLPELVFHGEQATIDDFEYEDIEIKDYVHGPLLRAPVAV